jgi:hypothetical protein
MTAFLSVSGLRVKAGLGRLLLRSAAIVIGRAVRCASAIYGFLGELGVLAVHLPVGVGLLRKDAD